MFFHCRLFFLLKLLVYFVTVDSVLFCSGRGYFDSSGNCVCGSNFHGQNCEFQYCPFGPSWLGLPYASNARNMSLSPCSDMGFCNPRTGECSCRDGYAGRACERLACPTLKQEVSYRRSIVTISAEGSYERVLPATVTSTLQCSGHGVCLTLREAGRGFDGLALRHPPVEYQNWDADKLQGCLCDYGWEGYDCSRRSCPKGRDPSDPLTPFLKEEIFYLQCQASSGYFSILVLGKFTEPIPFDADPGLLKLILESVPNVGSVKVKMEAVEGVPSLCGAHAILTTTIEFTSHFGSRPPILVTPNVSTSSMWAQSSEPLALSGSSPVLRLKTIYQLTCSNCTNCDGRVYLTYGNSVSHAVNITANNASESLSAAISSLFDLFESNWPSFNLSIISDGSSNRICLDGGDATVAIELYSTMGNIEGIGVIDASVGTDGIQLISNKGNGSVYECSNQGICDYSTGRCSCNQLQLGGQTVYRAMSSDGRQALGSRADCGFLNPPLKGCSISGADACNNRGFCSNESSTCSCFEGWFGLTCNLKKCPLGPAIFDEPTTATSAHGLSECSNAGFCDRQSGLCECRPGFSGKACEIRDCPSDSRGVRCSGHGVCVSISEFYSYFGLSYGNASVSHFDSNKNTWDAANWYECLCTTAASIASKRWPSYYPVYPSLSLSGSDSGSQPLAGWSGWDCSRRNCPIGRSPLFSPAPNLEIQRVICSEEDSAFFFQLSIFGETSEPIFGHFRSAEIRKVLEGMLSIGNVSIIFPNESVDGISTACNSSVNITFGGFLIEFKTELGDLPLAEVVGDEKSASVTISKFRSGEKIAPECSGSAFGACLGNSGLCTCNYGKSSSNGMNESGVIGDCGFVSPYPTSKDSSIRFNS